MSRGIDSTAKTEIGNSNIHTAVFVRLGDSDDLALWSGYGTLTYDSIDYVGSGRLLQVGQVSEEQGIVGNSFTMTLTGLSSEVTSFILDTDAHGQAASAYVAALDENGDIVGDLINVFTGNIDTVVLNTSRTSSDIAVTCSHLLMKFEKSTTVFGADADQQANFSGDLFYEYLTSTITTDFKFG